MGGLNEISLENGPPYGLISPKPSAGNADVLEAQGVCSRNLVCQFTATVEDADEGWEHYADW